MNHATCLCGAQFATIRLLLAHSAEAHGRHPGARSYEVIEVRERPERRQPPYPRHKSCKRCGLVTTGAYCRGCSVELGYYGKSRETWAERETA